MTGKLQNNSHGHLRWLNIQPVFAVRCPYGVAHQAVIVVKDSFCWYPRSVLGVVACNHCSGWRRRQYRSGEPWFPSGNKSSLNHSAPLRGPFGQRKRPLCSRKSLELPTAKPRIGSQAVFHRQPSSLQQSLLR